MNDNLSVEDIAVILASLEYSKQRIRDAVGTPLMVRNEKLAALDKISEKLHVRKNRLANP